MMVKVVMTMEVQVVIMEECIVMVVKQMRGGGTVDENEADGDRLEVVVMMVQLKS